MLCLIFFFESMCLTKENVEHYQVSHLKLLFMFNRYINIAPWHEIVLGDQILRSHLKLL
jgi:hypothetical protein